MLKATMSYLADRCPVIWHARADDSGYLSIEVNSQQSLLAEVNAYFLLLLMQFMQQAPPRSKCKLERLS